MNLANAATNLFLHSNGDGNVFAISDNGEGYQNWLIINDGNGYFYLQDTATNKFLDSNSNGDVYTSIGNGGDSQKWYFSEDNLINKANGKYLESNNNGAVYASASNSADSQRWKTDYLGNIYFHLTFFNNLYFKICLIK